MIDLETKLARLVDRQRVRIEELGKERAALVAEAQVMRLSLEDERRARDEAERRAALAHAIGSQEGRVAALRVAAALCDELTGAGDVAERLRSLAARIRAMADDSLASSRDQGTSDAGTPPRWPGQTAAEALPAPLVQAMGALLDAYVAHAQAGFPLGATGVRSCEAEQRVVSEILALVRAERSRATEAERELADIERRAQVEEPEGQTIRQLNVSVRRLRDENHEQRIRAQAAERRAEAAEARERELREGLERLAADAERQSKLNPPQFGDPIAVAGPWAWKRMADLIRDVLAAASPSRRGDATGPTAEEAAEIREYAGFDAAVAERRSLGTDALACGAADHPVFTYPCMLPKGHAGPHDNGSGDPWESPATPSNEEP